MSKVHSVPPIVEAENGLVVVHRPDDVEVHLTPIAAVETARKLLDAAAAAEGDRLISEEMAARRPPS